MSIMYSFIHSLIHPSMHAFLQSLLLAHSFDYMKYIPPQDWSCTIQTSNADAEAPYKFICTHLV